MTPGLNHATSFQAPYSIEAASPVSLTIPGVPEFFLVARMSARAVATCLEADLDQIEDLRLLIDEVCTLSSEGGDVASRMTLVYAWDEGHLDVCCSTSGVAANVEDGEVTSTRELSAMILEALCDSYGIEPVETGSRTVWFRLRRPGT